MIDCVTFGFVGWIADRLEPVVSMFRPRCEWATRYETNRTSEACWDEDHWEIFCKRHKVWFTGHITLEKADFVAEKMMEEKRTCRRPHREVVYTGRRWNR